ncbi:Decaprenyl diphosphate synthase-like protein [Bombardia bombarda]|uniref:Alkyl transferase n=1 Tax=Bombardia bombarda TaxID=252184 RepID=A0AA39XJ17_9PEZI|nr:Decaprenyl diphosphate synthase-like protein [Bombardia bombarda]
MSDLYLSRVRNWFLSSPPAEWVLSQLHEVFIGSLKQGPIPRHVAFIMDGNRRYAKSHKIETIEGHHLGFEALAGMLEVCFKCGVEVVTIYAFSVENFNRPQYEVDGLMQLAKLKMEQLVQHGSLLERYGAGVRVLGQRELLSPDVLEVFDRVARLTKDNNNHILNICFPYTSRAEITSAVRSTIEEYTTTPRPHNTPFSQSRIAQKIQAKQGNKTESLSSVREASPPPPSPRSDDPDGSVSSSATLYQEDSPKSGTPTPQVTIYPNAENITAETIDSHMYTAGCPPLDLYIRTSGVERLSDFMLWQCHQDTQIFFLKCLWPEFGLWDFLPVLVEWQWRQKQKEREKPSQRVKQA